MARALRCAITFALLGLAVAQHDPNFKDNRTTIVHLFEWRWNDIAEECEKFLGPNGYGGVQTSPPNENAVINQGEQTRPWWERYQPVSYKLETRSGTEDQFKTMVRRCNDAGVRIYVDAVINHMTGNLGQGKGTGGSEFDSVVLNYSTVPYSNLDFHGRNECTTKSGNIENYRDAKEVRNCKLSGLNDLKLETDSVREKIVEYFNKLVGYGVAGFRIDASKHMWPGDLKAIYENLNNLSTEHGFVSDARPFIYQEVIDNGGEAISSSEYTSMGRVTEFKVCGHIGNVFRRKDKQQLQYLKNWGEGWAFLPSDHALVFVDNHDNQRGHGGGGDSILTFRLAKLYKLAQAFNLAWPYGVTRVMSSYSWDQNIVGGHDRNDWVGPPHDSNFNIRPVTIKTDGSCGSGWVCEHRWKPIYSMVQFRNIVQGTEVNNWWDNKKDQIAFSRGDKGFIAINNDDYPFNSTIKTGLAPGQYCDIITGGLVNGKCTGKVITLDKDGMVHLDVSNAAEDPMIAIHVNAKL